MKNKKKYYTISNICTKASFGSIIIVIPFIFAFFLVTISQNHKRQEHETLQKLKIITQYVENSISGEIMIQDKQAVSIIIRYLKKKYDLTSLSISKTQLSCDIKPSFWFFSTPKEACYSEKFSNTYPNYYLKVKSAIPNMSQFDTILSLFIICAPLLLLSLIITLIIQHKLKQSIVWPMQLIVNNPETFKPQGNIIAMEVIEIHQQLLQYITERDLNQAETLKVQASLVEMASQVVHNIRSPLSVLDNMLTIIKSHISETNHNTITRQLHQIRQIATNFLEYNKKSLQDIDNKTDKAYCSLINILDTIIENKQVEWSHNQCNITIISKTSEFVWLYLNEYEFKSVLSNLLDNAYEAMPDEKHNIEISITNDINTLKITIKDQGRGIPKHEIENILRGKTLKPTGNGIGLPSAIKYVKSLNGTLILTSTENIGTTVEISLPKVETPRWCIDKISLPRHHQIAIVDDDFSIHSIWQRKLFKLSLNLRYFTNGTDFIQWYNALENKDNLTVLMDYDLQKDTPKGLDILIQQNINNAIIVTTCADQTWLQIQVEKTPYYLVPKFMLKDIQIIA